MFEESINILDKRRIEIKQWLSCDSSKGTAKYQVDTWFFLPAPLQIDKWSYSPQLCQKRLKTYLRQRAPLIPMAALGAKYSLLVEARQQLIAYNEAKNESTPTAKQMAQTIDLFKMYQLLIKRALYAQKKQIQSIESPAARFCATLALFGEVNRALCAYRRLRSLTLFCSQLLEAFDYCDEYTGIIITHHMHSMIHEQPWNTPYQLHTLRAFWKAQMCYRMAYSPASVPRENSDNELPVYRWGTLKKYVADPLFLNIRRKTGNSLLVHIIYSLSAALAMIFATAIAFVWQEQYGALSGPLFVAMVIGYIFKDRMKELCRDHLFKLFQHHVPDCRQNIYTDDNACIGTCNESFRFLDEAKQPDVLRQIRAKQKFASVRHENILHYTKQVKIRHLSNPFQTNTPMIMEIWRFDISDFLLHILDASEELPTLADEQVVLGQKVYYVNIVRRIVQENYEAWERFRLVLNHEGIKRVEELRALTPLAAVPVQDTPSVFTNHQ